MTPSDSILHFIKNSLQDTWPTKEVQKYIQELNPDELESLMQQCVEFSHLPLLQMLFTYVPVVKDAKLRFLKNTLIIEAIKQYQWDLIPVLIQNNFEVNCQDADNNTPLHLIIAVRDTLFEKPSFLKERKALIDKLILNGATIDARNDKGETPLFRAVKCRPELVDKILKYNPDINAVDEQGRTPLMISPNKSISQLLISHHARVDLKDLNGNTALSLATKQRNMGVIKLLQNLTPSQDQEISFLSLPNFTFFSREALMQTGVLDNSDDPCNCCEKSRGYLYSRYEDDLQEIKVCPWCIADGKHAKKYEVGVHDIMLDPEQSVVDKTDFEELQMRTPGFTGWQEEKWLVHCHTPCTFLGRVGWKDVKKIFSKIKVEDSDLCEDRDILKSLDAEFAPTGYLFRCIKCSQLLMYSDAD